VVRTTAVTAAQRGTRRLARKDTTGSRPMA